MTNTKAHDLLPPDQPNYCGTVGALATANAGGGREADLVILARVRAGLLLGGRSGVIIPPGARIVQIDIDGSEMGRLTPVAARLVADCSAGFKTLTACAAADMAGLDGVEGTSAHGPLGQPWEAEPPLGSKTVASTPTTRHAKTLLQSAWMRSSRSMAVK